FESDVIDNRDTGNYEGIQSDGELRPVGDDDFHVDQWNHDTDKRIFDGDVHDETAFYRFHGNVHFWEYRMRGFAEFSDAHGRKNHSSGRCGDHHAAHDDDFDAHFFG